MTQRERRFAGKAHDVVDGRVRIRRWNRCDGHAGIRASRVNRIARSRNSSGYFRVTACSYLRGLMVFIKPGT